MNFLIVVDMQNDFIDGSLGSKEAKAIVNNVKEEIKRKKEEGYTILFTRDTHFEDYLNTMEGSKLPVKHCIKGTKGWEICDELKEFVTLGTLVYDKETFGCKELANDLLGYSDLVGNNMTIELVGLCTDICVISNAMLIKAFIPEATIVIKEDCCAGVTPKSHENALEAMKMCHIDIL